MTKTLPSITLLLLASGWLSILPAETQAKYVCVYCNKEFSSKSEENQKCPQNIKRVKGDITFKGDGGQGHQFRTK